MALSADEERAFAELRAAFAAPAAERVEPAAPPRQSRVPLVLAGLTIALAACCALSAWL